MMKRYSLYLLIGIFCTLWSCSDDEDVTPSLKDEGRLEALIDKSNSDIMAFKEKYGTYILYEFDQLKDFAYQFEQAATWREAKLTFLEKEDVSGAVAFLEEHFFNCYQDTVKLNMLPRKFLICSKVYGGILGVSNPDGEKVGLHDAMANMNSFTVARLDRATLAAMSAERRDEFIRQIHYMFLGGYIVNVQRNIFVEDLFFDPASKLYGTRIEREKGEILPADYYMSRGFFPITDKEQYYYPLQMEDLSTFVEHLLKMDEETKEVIWNQSVMRTKMQYVAKSLKAMGVDVAKINPLAEDFL